MNFRATTPQRRFKAKIYQKYPKMDFSKVTAVELQTLTGNRSIQKWWDDEGFRDWLLEKDFTKHLLESGIESAVERLIKIVECNDVGPGGEVTAAAQVAAANKLLEYAGYAPPSKRVIEYKDKDIAAMDEAQLKEFITKNLKVVK